MKKFLVVLLALGMLLSMMPATLAEEPVTLDFLSVAWILEEQIATKEVIDKWNAENPNIQVNLIQGDWGTLNVDLLTGFETGTAPDLFHNWTGPLLEWRDTGWLADLSPMLDEESYADVSEEVWNALRASDGSIIALPFQSECDVTFYNIDLFEKAGIVPPTVEDPWTLDELIENCKKLLNVEEGVSPLAIKGYFDGFVRYFNDIWATKIGASPVVMGEDGKYKVELSDEYIALAEKMKAMCYEDGIIAPYDGTDETAAFMDGKLAIYAGIGCWQRGQYLAVEDSNVNWGMLPAITIDTADNYTTIQTISLTESCEHKEEAMEFLKYFWNYENQVKICSAAYIFSCRNSVLASPEMNDPATYWDLAQLAAQSLVVPEHAVLPEWSAFFNGIGSTIYNEYFTDMIDTETFVDRVESEGNRVFQEIQSYS